MSSCFFQTVHKMYGHFILSGVEKPAAVSAGHDFADGCPCLDDIESGCGD